MVFSLALAAALSYGAGDFLGAIATTRTKSALPVVATSSLAGVVLLLVVAPWSAAAPTSADFAWGAAGGIAGGVGVALFYRGLAAGVMSVVAPVAAVTGAVVPVAAGLIMGERPSAVALTGVGLAIGAVALLAVEAPGTREVVIGSRRHALLLALGAGAGFGVFFVLLDRTGDDAGLWPLVASRSVTLLLAVAAAVAIGQAVVPVRGARRLSLGTGLFDMIANACFLIANRSGLLALVAVITSLYPASTIALAQVFLGERLAPHQLVGVGVAVAAVVLIAVG
ncbi:MAG: EamA family transporter [Acidimicrobiia bacterium]|jgi:drug/metabolite transporter (DMT)-like permease